MVAINKPPIAPAIPPIPTTEPTAPAGNISDVNVNKFAENPWWHAAASPINITADQVLSTRYANTTGITPIAQINIAVLRATLTLLPRFINAEDIQPPTTLPTSEIK